MPSLSKGVLLAAGLGTRLVPYSKEMPKEMLPVFFGVNNSVYLKPVIQAVFEQFYEAGIREFCFVVGRGKRVIEDHFTPDWDFVEYLEKTGKNDYAELLRDFYEKVEKSYITWVNQPVPRGTGHAVYMAKGFVGDDYFMAAATDNLFLGENIPRRLLEYFDRLRSPMLAVKRVRDPRRYGVVIGSRVDTSIYRVEGIVEKPREPLSYLANTSLYIFPPEIFRAIEQTTPSPRGELEVTDSIQILIRSGYQFYAYEAEADWIDIGTWETFLRAALVSLKHALGADKLSEILSELGIGAGKP
ncbi:UTP--glucose-1-phosphate uridylyltransferase [Thermofilum pendens]|uniref:UTP--glucose-1-phosphate uridylyltransferase n=1 Tax=Thermofilum pendens (strain DSM 2475 / Hrk 5) TaxID=368408 RepID=A1S194_THEPD|nr:sugar phosphate nucleotidyltransferase [Thermofilum pendens]ABL79224.1 UDP-glucose pyrophosphorylase [Thermofilum pendens Hrk 5]